MINFFYYLNLILKLKINNILDLIKIENIIIYLEKKNLID